MLAMIGAVGIQMISTIMFAFLLAIGFALGRYFMFKVAPKVSMSC